MNIMDIGKKSENVAALSRGKGKIEPLHHNNVDTPNKTRNCFSLKEWTRLAQRSISNSCSDSATTNASSSSSSSNAPPAAAAAAAAHNSHLMPPVASKAYLNAALQVGYFLASQICALEERERNEGNFNDSNSARNIAAALPEDFSNWSQNIVIQVSDSYFRRSSCDEASVGGAKGEAAGESKEFGFRWGAIDETRSIFDDASIGYNQSPMELERCNPVIFDVIDAKIEMQQGVSPSSSHIANQGGIRSRHVRIHSLGIVFYELFSGGLRPSEHSDGATAERQATVHRDVPDYPSYDPIPVAASKSMDLSGALRIIDPSNHVPGHFGVDADDPFYDPLPLEESKEVDVSDILGVINVINGTDGLPRDGAFSQGVPDYPLHDPLTAMDFVDSLDFDSENVEYEEEIESPNKRAFLDSSYIKKNPQDQTGLSWLPTLICNLISNMVDAIYGDLSGDLVYQCMADVQDDLKWMLANLDRILLNLDPNEVSNKGLLFGNFLYGREKDVFELKEARRSSLLGGSMAVVSGSSGTGKSCLAQEIVSISSQSGSIVLSGKYDQLQQAKPFSAVVSAFADYFESLIQQDDQITISNIASKLHEAIGNNGIVVLGKLIPNLTKILGQEMIVKVMLNDCVNAQKRVQYFLSSLVEVISSLFSGGLTFFLDDLQWADMASIKFIHHLMLRLKFSKESIRLFFLGCCRNEEIVNNEPFQNMMREVKQFGIKCTRIQLKRLDIDCVNAMISDLLCLSPRQTRRLSDIVFHKTQGNPLFVVELVKSLYKERMLSFSLSCRQWVWDIEKINALGVSDDVAMVLTKTLNDLHVDVKESLCVASCFGASLESLVLQRLEGHLGMKLSDSLNIAVTEGLMYKRGDHYVFVHDRVQWAAYNLMKEEERCLRHLEFGIPLCSFAAKECNDDMFFTAIDQVNRGGPSAIADRSQFHAVAELNLMAGKLSMERSDFSTAFSFFDHGISYLRKGHWKEHYNLSLQLFIKAAKCAFAIGDMTSLALMSDQVMKNASCFEDTLLIKYINIRALETMSLHSKAVEKGVSILAQLGVDLVRPSASWKTNGLLTETKAMLLASDHDLLNHTRMTDPKIIMVMRFLQRMLYSLFMVNPKSQPEATLRMVQLSLTHGLNSLSPTAFAAYGSLLASLGEVQEGYRYVKLAINLLARVESREAASEVYAVASQVMAYVEPMQSQHDLMYRAHKLGLESGDTVSAMYALALYNVGLFWVGKNLHRMKASMEECLNYMGQYNTVCLIPQCLPLYRSALTLIGDDEGTETFLGKTLAWSESEKEITLLQSNVYSFNTVNFNRMYASFMLRRYSNTKEFAEKYFSHSPVFFTRLLAECAHAYYGGLASFLIARVTKEDIWFERGEKAVSTMRRWANCSSWNFQNKLCLLEAEKCYCLNDREGARKLYEAAISSAAEHRFQHEEGLSCELAGYFSLDDGQPDVALSYFLHAHEKYHSWGAFAKATSLYNFIEKKFNIGDEKIQALKP